jgi:drug/metabolite transporter (DMT)-like permease
VFTLTTNANFSAPQALSAMLWLYLFAATLILMVATLVVQYGVTKMAATQASVLFVFELVVAAIASYYLAHETMAIKEWIGGGLIMAAAVFAALNHND